jgi:DeoR/GlpR family transcriptional regulator of sugar metabolism
MSTTAVTHDRCFHQSQETVQVKRAFLESASYRVLMIDHTKFLKSGLHELARLEDFDLVVVDSETDAQVVEHLTGLDVEIRVAEPIAATGTGDAVPQGGAGP